jgi:hypothetical protein
MQINIYLVDTLLPLCFCNAVPHPPACCLFLPRMYPYTRSLRLCWISRRNTICPYTAFSFDPEPARQLKPNSCHRAFVPHPLAYCLHLLTIYPYFYSLRRCRVSRHHAIDYKTSISFVPEPARQLSPNSCHRRALVQHPSTSCLRLLSIYPYVPSSGRCWRPRPDAIDSNTEISFDPEPARQLNSNSCHLALVQHPSPSCLRLLTILRGVPSSGRCWDPNT